MIEPPRPCSYLAERTERLELRGIADLNPTKYGDLLARGYRRFGWLFFRPACEVCRECRSVRLIAPEFAANAGQRRILRKNEHIRAELHPLFVSREHIDLYNRYQRFMQGHRSWQPRAITSAEYRDEFLSGAAHVGRQWLYFDGDRLVGVALMDEASDAISLVYCFYDPDWRASSPGTFSILRQIAYAQERNLKHVYLGYWVEACQSLSYKGRFGPREILREYPSLAALPVWERG